MPKRRKVETPTSRNVKDRIEPRRTPRNGRGGAGSMSDFGRRIGRLRLGPHVLGERATSWSRRRADFGGRASVTSVTSAPSGEVSRPTGIVAKELPHGVPCRHGIKPECPLSLSPADFGAPGLSNWTYPHLFIYSIAGPLQPGLATAKINLTRSRTPRRMLPKLTIRSPVIASVRIVFSSSTMSFGYPVNPSSAALGPTFDGGHR